MTQLEQWKVEADRIARKVKIRKLEVRKQRVLLAQEKQDLKRLRERIRKCEEPLPGFEEVS